MLRKNLLVVFILTLNFLHVSKCFVCENAKLQTTFINALDTVLSSGASNSRLRNCDGIFDQFKNEEKYKTLQSLTLDCKLSSIPNQAFAQLSELRKLDLSNNKIHRCPPQNWFAAANRLSSLHMAGNEMRNPCVNTYQHLTGLRYMDLSRNVINNIAGVVSEQWKELHFLNLSHNVINGFISGSLDMGKLQLLDLSYNDIDYLDEDVFDYLTNLQVLNLYNNRIKFITKRFFKHMTRLEVLRIGRNRLEQQLTEDTFDTLTNLKELDISYMNLETVSTKLLQMRLLTCLDVSGNKFKNIGHNVASEFQGLKYLNISNNKMGDLRINLASNQFNLEVLDISLNGIKSFINVLPKFINLKELIARNNSIRQLPTDMAQTYAKLNYLDLQFNQFVAFDMTLLNSLTALHRFEMVGNPFECKCMNALLLELQRRGIQYESANHFNGAKPVCIVLQPNNTLCEFSNQDIDKYHQIFMSD